ncbi:hypothetical protein AAG570_005018 [Ranatra chinensis]|uniref:E3 ubiquitin-protein ligase MIB2 n=1 Tax=Ranatra chinensis TaxID=642074 RepID=A0ABD0XZC0_9HEMI
MLSVGCRVVRGPDWVWGEQDGGEGHCGTLFQVGRPGSKQSPDKTVVVIWDTGRETNYRVGYNNAYDLRLLDNAPAGVKHPNIICDSCKRSQGIVGMRFKCCSCFDFDLCFHCYMSDKHDLNHIFQRFDTPHSVGVELTARKGSTKLNYYGTFIGAKVVRGSHWEWNDQDGGEGKTGRVLDVRGWDNETGRSVVNVTWTSGFSNIYRMGHKGRVDLTCVEPALGGTYYCDHLPVLGRDMEVYENRGEGVSSHLTFSVGDKVKVVVDVDTLRRLQEGHGGWNPRMVECVGATGQVHRVTDRGDIRVCYDGNMRWTLNPAALAKLHSFSVNDVVMVDYDVIRVKHLQKGHGEWIDPMVSILGKLGKVTKIYSDGDLRVTVDGQTWTLNPLSVQLWAGSTAELENIMESHPSSTAQDADSTSTSRLAKLIT